MHSTEAKETEKLGKNYEIKIFFLIRFKLHYYVEINLIYFYYFAFLTHNNISKEKNNFIFFFQVKLK